MKRIRKRDLIRILHRSFYIQGAWNYERMLGLGICFCLIPIAKRICETEEQYRNFLERHLDFFNSHPYMASFALGSITKLEEEAILKNWDDYQPITIFKERLCGPLGAIGDNIFWRLLKPLSAALGVGCSILFGWIGVVLLLVFYNFFHFSVRASGIYLGFRKGFDIIRDISISGTKKYVDILRNITAFAIGMLTIITAYWSKTVDKGLTIFLLTFGVSLLITIPKKLSVEMSIIIVISISITLGLMIS